MERICTDTLHDLSYEQPEKLNRPIKPGLVRQISVQQHGGFGAVCARLRVQLRAAALEIAAADGPAHGVDGIGADAVRVRVAAQACGEGGFAGQPNSVPLTPSAILFCQAQQIAS